MSQAESELTQSELTQSELTQLKDLSLAARSGAYCPYSKFRVGACVLTGDGSFIQGANVENASYPAGICAERAALVQAVTQGKRDIRAIGISSDLDEPCSPCGVCRQFIREFAELDLPIYMYTAAGEATMRSLGQLLPMSFGPAHLGK